MQSNARCSSGSSASSLEPTAVTSTSSPPPISSTIGLPLRLVVLDDEQALDAALDEAADLANVSSSASFVDRLLEERDRAGPQRVLLAVAAPKTMCTGM